MKPNHVLREKTLTGKLVARIFFVLVVVFSLMITSISYSAKKNLMEKQLQILELLAKENATIVSEFMKTMLDKQQVLMKAIQLAEKMDEDNKISYISDLLDGVGRVQDDILSLYFVSEPNQFFQNTPNGFSIFTSEDGSRAQPERFQYVDDAIYQTVLDTKKVVIADPFQKIIDGKEYTVITVLQPMLDEHNQVVGVIGSNIDINVLLEAPYDKGGFQTFQNEVICAHKTVIMSSKDPTTIGKSFSDVSTSMNTQEILNSVENAMSLTLLNKQKTGENLYSAYTSFYIGTSQTPWLSGSSISEKEFLSHVYKQIIMMIVISILGMSVLLLVLYFTLRRMLNPLKEMEYAVSELSKGNLSVRITHQSNDEMGRLANSFNESIQTIRFYISDIDRAMNEMGKGNFDVYPTKKFIGDFSGIELSITHFLSRICHALNRMGEVSDTVFNSAEQVSSASITLSQGAAEQAASINELTTTMIALSEQVRKNDQHAKLAGEKVKEAAQQLQMSNDHMQKMTEAMQTITQRSKEIDHIIKTIEDIAFQTNILALNAAVEAAHAGDTGKGFAVVAEEVRNLASKSAQAAKNTASMIQNSMKAVDNGGEIANEAAESLILVSKKASAVMEIVNEICVESQNQLNQIETLSSSTEQISNVIQINSATSEESAAASEELESQAQTLKTLNKQFQLNKMLTK